MTAKEILFDRGYIIPIICGTLILSILLPLLYYIPIWDQEWKVEKAKLDSMTCKDLGVLLVKHSMEVNENGAHTSLFNYIDAKIHAGDCK